MKLFKGLDLSVRDFMDSNLHWVNSLGQFTVFLYDFKLYQKDKSLENKTGGVNVNIPFLPH